MRTELGIEIRAGTLCVKRMVIENPSSRPALQIPREPASCALETRRAGRAGAGGHSPLRPASPEAFACTAVGTGLGNLPRDNRALRARTAGPGRPSHHCIAASEDAHGRLPSRVLLLQAAGEARGSARPRGGLLRAPPR